MAGSEAPALRKPPATATPIRLPLPRQSPTLPFSATDPFVRRVVETAAYRIFVSDADEDLGRTWLREAEATTEPSLHPDVARLMGVQTEADPVADAQAEADWPLVAQLLRALEAAGLGGRHVDAYAELQADRVGQQYLAGWTRERWQRTVRYIEGDGCC